MFCPRCGQEKISDELRFCSRCGLPLNLVTEIVRYEGILPQLAQIQQRSVGLTRDFGMKFGLGWFLLLTFLVTPLIAVLENFDDLVPVTAILGFIGGILIVIFSALFLKHESKYRTNNLYVENEVQNLSGNQLKQDALPSRQTIPADEYASPGNSRRAPDTGDLAKPPSVTEGTTKLLDKNLEE